jgi:hypothetical protein
MMATPHRESTACAALAVHACSAARPESRNAEASMHVSAEDLAKGFLDHFSELIAR